MATYLKRTSKLFDISCNSTSGAMNIRDFICPVCRGILIEPVTLPCTHNLCHGCLKGTFEHNSLNCPLCRVRVGSWVRTATKSETLVNNALWQLIRTRFPKEIESKRNGDDVGGELEEDFTSKKLKLSAAGEIRREYEEQLQMAEKEMRRQRETERLANEELIRKIQAEDKQQQLAQLAKDQFLAKTLAKKQLLGKEKCAMQCKSSANITNIKNSQISHPENANQLNYQSGKDIQEPRKSNFSIIAKIRGEKSNASNNYKDPSNSCVQKLLPIHNAVTRTLKHQTIAQYSAEPSCSGTQIYGTQSKEELHVPKDVLSSKKKSLGVEVCMTSGVDGGERIGSAESAGSHDSINQEIHHFKPIKPIARTALKLSHDGRSIDPKLVRVVPIFKRVTNVVPKPPSPMHAIRNLGCSWSAFRGKARQSLEQLQASKKSETDVKTSSTSSHLHPNPHLIKLNKPSQPSEASRRLDLAPDVSVDTNKNYAKSINRFLNGTKVSKKLILEDTPDTSKPQKPTRNSQNNNGTVPKSKLPRNLSRDRESSSSPENSNIKNITEFFEEGSMIENIAERIKRRKVNRNNVTIIEPEVPVPVPRNTRRRPQPAKFENDESPVAIPEEIRAKRKRIPAKSTPRTKRPRFGSTESCSESESGDRKKAKRTKRSAKVTKIVDPDEVDQDFSRDETNLSFEKKNSEEFDLDERFIEEQQRMERIIAQEKEDFELAQRLQAQFNYMERIAGRTRGSRRAVENCNVGEETTSRRLNATATRGNTSNESQSNKRQRSQKQGVQ